MNVTYTVNAEPFSFVVEGDDLSDLTTGVYTRIRDTHTGIADDPALLVRVTDGLLNSLADERDEIALGELSQ